MRRYPARPTWYEGRRYRSRQEAELQRRFDQSGARTEYEPKAFDAPWAAERAYLPDWALYQCRFRWANASTDYRDVFIESKPRWAFVDTERVFNRATQIWSTVPTWIIVVVPGSETHDDKPEWIGYTSTGDRYVMGVDAMLGDNDNAVCFYPLPDRFLDSMRLRAPDFYGDITREAAGSIMAGRFTWKRRGGVTFTPRVDDMECAAWRRAVADARRDLGMTDD